MGLATISCPSWHLWIASKIETRIFNKTSKPAEIKMKDVAAELKGEGDKAFVSSLFYGEDEI